MLLGLLACYGFMAAKALTATKQYDYIGLTQIDNYLQVATAPVNLENVKVATEHQNYDGNVGFLLAKVNELEAQGYELVDQSVYSPGPNANIRHYMLLRRPKQLATGGKKGWQRPKHLYPPTSSLTRENPLAAV